MQKYVEQLLADIESSIENSNVGASNETYNIWDFITDEEEESTCQRKNLQELTGIRMEQLPPSEKLTDEQLNTILEVLKKMLDAYNWMFVMAIEVEPRLQYNCIRENFNQTALIKKWNMGFFEICKPGTEHYSCALKDRCHCAFFKELTSGFEKQDYSDEEEKIIAIDLEISHLKRQHGEKWYEHFPFHLYKEFNKESDNGSNFGFDDDDENDDWWRH